MAMSYLKQVRNKSGSGIDCGFQGILCGEILNKSMSSKGKI